MKESDIQRTILAYLTLRGIFHYKNSTVGIYKQSTGSYIPSQSIGSPDIVCIIKGKYVGLEVKRPGGKQSEHQKEFQQNLERAGGTYILTSSLDDLISKLEKNKPPIAPDKTDPVPHVSW